MNKKNTIEEIKEINNYLSIVDDLVRDLIYNVDELDVNEMYDIRSYICRIILNKTNKVNKIIQNEIRNNDILKEDMQYIRDYIEKNVNKYGYVLLPELNQERLREIIKDIKSLKKGYDY